MKYTSFTDIAFNPDKSINCQAKAAAVYVSLRKKGILEQAIENKDTFLNMVYGEIKPVYNTELQFSLWDKL